MGEQLFFGNATSVIPNGTEPLPIGSNVVRCARSLDDICLIFDEATATEKKG